MEKLSEPLPLEVAEKVENILLNEIGCAELEYIEKDENLTIYYVYANGYKIAITAGDDGYNIFKPHERTLYDDGKVLLTYDTLQKITINSSDEIYYRIIA